MLSILSIALEHENPLALASELSPLSSFRNETRGTFDLHFTLVFRSNDSTMDFENREDFSKISTFTMDGAMERGGVTEEEPRGSRAA